MWCLTMPASSRWVARMSRRTTVLSLRPSRSSHDLNVVLASFLLVLSFLLGGGGAAYAFNELAIKLFALMVLGFHAAGAARPRPARTAWEPIILVGLAIVVFLLQLVPLPPALWRALPGQEIARSILDGVGEGQSFRPLSLDLRATWRAVTALLPALAMLLAVIHMDRQGRLLLARIVLACALVTLAVGMVQFLSGGTLGLIYETAHQRYPIGLFTNRNHQATFLLMAIVLTAIAPLMGGGGARRRASGWISLGLVLALSAGVVATTSRAGLLLLPVVLGAVLLLRYPGRTIWPVALTIVGAFLLAQHNGMVQRVLDRLASGNVDRLRFWQDTLVAIRDYWPVGSGLGTFIPVFQTVEPLDHVGSHYVNHAHNDYLELLLEGGVAGAAFILLGLAWLVRATVALRRMSPEDARLGAAGLAGLLVLLLHSLVDYPVRMLSIEVVGAMLMGFLTPVAGGKDGLSDRLDGAGGRGRRHGLRKTGEGAGAHSDRGIGDPHRLNVLGSIDAELPIGAARTVIAPQPERGIENRGAVPPDAQRGHDPIRGEFPDPVNPAADDDRCGPTNRSFPRGVALAPRVGDDVLDPAIDPHGDEGLRSFGLSPCIVDLADDRWPRGRATGSDILEEGDGRRLAEGEGRAADQFGPLIGTSALPVIGCLIARPDREDGARLALIMPDRIGRRRGYEIFGTVDYYGRLRGDNDHDFLSSFQNFGMYNLKYFIIFVYFVKIIKSIG